MLNVQDLYASHLGRVYAFFAYRVGAAADAEDLTSATFERVVRHAARYDANRAGVSTWLFAIAERVLIDHYRRQGRRNERPLVESDDRAVMDSAPSEGLAAPLQEALAALTDRERRIIGLRFGADLSARDIARLTHTTEANVHQLLSRTLRKMRGQLGDVSRVR